MIFSNSRKSTILSLDNERLEKESFLKQLEDRLIEAGLDSKRIIVYYDELIQDAIESGESETEFINRIDNIDDIIDQIKTERGPSESQTPLKRKVKRKLIKEHQLRRRIHEVTQFISSGFRIIVAAICVGLIVFGVGLSISGITRIMTSVPEIFEQIPAYGLLAIGVGLILIGFGGVGNLDNIRKHISGNDINNQAHRGALSGGRK
ncbi:MAG: DUF1700 domain-containing protein [Candidatus Izemoplasmatales bacterium]